MIKVNKRCLVNFSIGKYYKYQVWCDVVSKNACHLLLGHLWQYDRRVIHDGYKNTYSFVKSGTKIILGHSKFESSPEPSKRKGSYFLSKSQFDKKMEGSEEAFADVLLEDN